MIIKASRITAESTHRHLYRHLMRADENEDVRIVQGREFALAEAVKDARHAKRRYGLRHVILSPEQAISPETFQKIVTLYQSEFGTEPPLMIVGIRKSGLMVKAMTGTGMWCLLKPSLTDAVWTPALSVSGTKRWPGLRNWPLVTL